MSKNIKDVIKNSEQKKKAFVQKMQEEKAKKEEAKIEAIKKITKNLFTEQELKELKDEILETAKDMKMTEIVDSLLAKKHCPMLTKTDKEWDCGKSGCVKDGEDFCRNINFLNQCPAIANYFNHQMMMKTRMTRSRLKKKVGKKEN